MQFRFCPCCATPLVERSIAADDSELRRPACPGEGCGYVHWGNPTPAVGALVEHEGEIILARNRLWPEGFFALVTGFLEAREDPRAAVAREVREELGLDVAETHLIGNYIFERKNEIMLCYHAIAHGTIRLGEELVEYRRYPPAALRPWKRATGLAVADWMRARPRVRMGRAAAARAASRAGQGMSANAGRIAAYLRRAGLESLGGREPDVERAVLDLMEAMSEKIDVSDPGSLYTYRVPMLTEDGACSIGDEMAPVPYDLTAILGGRSEQTTRRLALLERLVERAQETSGADWVGVYQKRTNPAGLAVLVKVAYVGRASRAEFPLTPEFAQRSTNSTVGLTGRSTVIDDVGKHVEAGGGFYVCDDGVQSEACVPILDAGQRVAGIVDAEARARAFFGAERLAVVAALALVAAATLP